MSDLNNELPPGWQQIINDEDKTNILVYYWHRETNSTQWDRPSILTESKKDEEKQIIEEDAPTSYIETEEDELPSGWHEYTDNEGRKYYHNDNLNITQWDKPIFIENELRPGWIEYTNNYGQLYYHNALLKKTQWKKPKLMNKVSMITTNDDDDDYHESDDDVLTNDYETKMEYTMTEDPEEETQINIDETMDTLSKQPKYPKKSGFNVLPILHDGTALLKFGRRGKPHYHQFDLSADNEKLRWYSTKKKFKESAINISSINEILTGQHTKEFDRIGWKTLNSTSFSIIYENKKKSLNVVAKSVDEMKIWVHALRRLCDMKKNGEILSCIKELNVEIDFSDKNDTNREWNYIGNFLQRQNFQLMILMVDNIDGLRKHFFEISKEANNWIIKSRKEYESIKQILCELTQRIQEVDDDKNNAFRVWVDLQTLKEKIKVINKEYK